MIIKRRLALKKRKNFYDLDKDGVTQSLLSMWLACRQKARHYLNGWNSRYHSGALMFGSLGHGMLELAYLDIASKKLLGIPSEQRLKKYSKAVEKQWLAENPKPKTQSREDLEEFLAVLEKTLPRYFAFWKNDFRKKHWIALEEKFKVVTEPDKGLLINVRGKRDGRLALRNELWLLETKTKSMINESQLLDVLALDFQVNLYTWAALAEFGKMPEGVLYNIVRKSALKRTSKEKISEYANRVAADIDSRPEFYFLRMEISISKTDILIFEKELFGMLKDFADWYYGKVPHYKNTNSCISKYGKCEYIGACSRDDFLNLTKRKVVFKELDDF